MNEPKIYTDSQNLDDFNRLRLTCAGTQQDLERQSIDLDEGLVLTFYMDDADAQSEPDELLTEGVVHYEDKESIWVASVDWSSVRHASDEEEPRHSGKPGPTDRRRWARTAWRAIPADRLRRLRGPGDRFEFHKPSAPCPSAPLVLRSRLDRILNI